jgi:choice-of-anchor B domain-containing protein
MTPGRTSRLARTIAFLALAWATSTLLLAHDGDLKFLHKLPAHPGTGYANALRRAPGARGDLDDNQRLALGATGFPHQGLTLLSWMTLADFGIGPGGNASSLWGYTSPGRRRYALLGLSSGTAFVDVTVPSQPALLIVFPGPANLARDVRTYQDHAYVVSEGGDGIQVFDLSQIDSGSVNYLGSVNDVAPSATHTLTIDEASGYLYRSGGGTTTGLRIYDIATNPSNPTLVGAWHDRYVHETTVHTFTRGPNAGKQIAFASGGFNSGFSQSAVMMLDVTDKGAIALEDIESYPGVVFCHQGALSEDGTLYYVNDEFYSAGSTRIVLDVTDVTDTANRFVTSFTSGSSAIAHNNYVHDGKLWAACYKAGLRVFDLTGSPTSPTEIAFFDTVPEDDGATFNGLWNVYPYFGDGLVLGSDLEKGLFVWYFGPPRLTLTLVDGHPDEIVPGLALPITVDIGELRPGDYQAGSATLHWDSGSGFTSVPLSDLGDMRFRGFLPALDCGTRIDWYVSADSTDGTVWTEPPGAPAELHEAVATVGYQTVFVDDFEIDRGWSAFNLDATGGDWERGMPVDDPAWPYDPVSDADGSGQCWLTENALGDTDVDAGAVRLVSPVIDMTGGRVRIAYDYFLRVTNNLAKADRLRVEIDANGGSGPWKEIARHDVDGLLLWHEHVIEHADLLASGVAPSATMQVRFTVNDADPVSFLEAGIDAFRVEIAACGAGVPFCTGDLFGEACPCSNFGAYGNGCAAAGIASGVNLSGTGDPAQNDVVLSGTGFPAMASPTAIVVRSPTAAATPVAFGDGVLCLEPPVVRLSASTASQGVSTHPISHGAGSGTFRYQIWYRNTPAGFCTPASFNVSNGYVIEWP